MRRKDRSESQQLRASTAERLEAIVEAAERAAEKVIDDAEAQAGRHISEAQAEAGRLVSGRLFSLAALTDSLLEQAGALRHQTEQLLTVLEDTKAQIAADASGRGQLGGQGAVTAQDEAAPRGAHLTAVAPIYGPGPGTSERPEEREERGTPAGARLLATQMAVSGSSREEIELKLRNGFEIEDTAAILDAILGPEGKV